MDEQRVLYPFLPVGCLTFLSDKAVMGGGHDMNPLVFRSDASGKWLVSNRARNVIEITEGSANDALL